ncbi:MULTISPECIES: 4Fe-4S dicluster domain-containing protein [unclassified Romboutsia]|uniref:4Fe-4S dicluster domain-containing protein n=1 Tax=unclassified Romboutsia TaxID=2626894 RepID=UPI0008202A59|nr:MULTISPECIES: 4Fe-4S dicluster domain-containing protein [unclassified Romboutsia]SCI21737.1 Electron transport protein hydN [uncultured Clostridium sp.]
MSNNLGSFVIADSSKCTGCRACELACFTKHNKDNNVGYTVGTVEVPVIPRLYLVKDEDVCMPIQCRHCEDAPCLNTCPVKAISREDGVMVVDNDKCIGCKTCLLACPFGAIDLQTQYKNGKEVEQRGIDESNKVAYKCDLCKEDITIACINACPNEALKLISPIEDKKSKNIKAALSLLLTNK